MPENVHVHERISYSSDFITSFRTNVNTISKKVCKQIFAHRIWKPRNKERHTLLAVKPLVHSKHLNFVCLNIRSLKNKTTSLFDFIVSQNLDVLALTETWLCNGDNINLNELLPPGYDIRHVDGGMRGGGVALIYKKDISFRNIVTTNEITQFELLDCIIKVNKLSTRVVVVYRPPPSCKNGLRYEDFAVEWASYTPPPHTSSSEEILFLVTPFPNSIQTNLPSSNHTYTKSMPKHIHHHYACSITSTHTMSLTTPTYAPHCQH